MESKQNAPERPKKNRSKKVLLIFIVILLVFCIMGFSVAGFYFWQKNKDASKKAEIIPIETTEEVEVIEDTDAETTASRFAEYKDVEITVKPNVKPYTVKGDLGNVANAKDFELKDKVKNLLSKNAFAAQPSTAKEFFQLYDTNRYENIPSFITTDSMLHTYHLVFSLSLKQLESEVLLPELKKLNKSMLEDAEKQYQALKGTEWENAAKRNIAFFAVGGKLLDNDIKIPDAIKTEAEKELKYINAHSNIKESPVMNMGEDVSNPFPTPADNTIELLKEDYSQYIPRGHYTRSDEMKNYFKAMMWYGRMNFRLKNDDEVKSAILITHSMSSEDKLKSWDKIYEPINFFVGKSDDITYYDFNQILSSVYNGQKDLSGFDNQEKLNEFINKAKELDPPEINSMPIFDSRFQTDREEEIMGFRFMGQRFTIDAAVFQRLVYREVGDKQHTCQDDPKTWIPENSRRLPKGLDITSSFGSEEAYSILEDLNETKYACYSENMDQMKGYVKELDKNTWTQNLYWGWLYNLKPLTYAKKSGYPAFMKNTAWERKDINTFLGSWTELKHDTILYAKQVYAELGGLFEENPNGYVEPNPEVYGRLISLVNMTYDGLEARGILTDSVKKNLDAMEELAAKLLNISIKELEQKKLTEEEYELIRYYGGDLEQFWIEAFKDEGVESAAQIDDHPAALIADVATDPGSGVVLEEGVGRIFEILVVVPIEGKLVLTKGGIFSQYEFTQPIDNRLTDEKWREMVDENRLPGLAEWQRSFIVQ